jgi:hypothetical protein
MPPGQLTGSRIRARRLMLGIRQAALARQVGISAAYLNLIEHNRRRIAGKLLAAVARALETEPGALAEGAEAALVSDLREAAAALPEAGAEPEAAEDLAGRLPGWAALVAAQHRRMRRLERTVERLTDRLAHDPQLSGALHELLSSVSSITSAASILVEPGEVDPGWQRRFHRNIHEDSQRLAGGVQALVDHLAATGDAARAGSTPQEELEAWLEARGHHLPELEGDTPADPAALAEAAPLPSADARALAAAWGARYRADAARLPLDPFAAAAEACGWDPAPLSARFDAPLSAVLRRLAALPTPKGAGRIGLAICDGSGALVLRKPAEGFPLPRFGAACPLWPLYQALARPGAPLRAVVEMAGRDRRRFTVFAVAERSGPVSFEAPPLHEAVMLIVPADRLRIGDTAPAPVGPGCRICPQPDCPARRTPSILASP